MSVCPAKTQINLGIRPVWSEASLSAEWVAKDPSYLYADSEDSDQTGLIWVFAGRTLTLLVLACCGSYRYKRHHSRKWGKMQLPGRIKCSVLVHCLFHSPHPVYAHGSLKPQVLTSCRQRSVRIFECSFQALSLNVAQTFSVSLRSQHNFEIPTGSHFAKVDIYQTNGKDKLTFEIVSLR